MYEKIARAGISKPLQIGFIVTLFVAVFLRFAWVGQQGFVEYDEGWLVNAADSMSRHLRGAVREYYVDFKACPVTSFLIAVPMAIFGETPAAIMYPPALMGLLGVCLVSYLAYRMYGPTASLIAFVIGAVSPMQNLFSRTVALDTPGFFFLCLSYLFVTLSPVREPLNRRATLALLFSGFILAIALASNYRALSCVILPSIVIFVREGFRLSMPKKVAVHLAGFFGGLLTLEALMRLFYPVSKGYFHVFAEQYKHIGGKTFGSSSGLLPSFNVRDGLNLFHSLIDLDNPITVALSALWLLSLPILLLRGKHRREDLELATILVIPFCMFSLLSVTALRGLTVAQPLLALAAARFITSIGNVNRIGSSVLGRGVLASLIALPTGLGLFRSVQPDVLGRSNGFNDAFKETCAKYSTGIITILDAGPQYYGRWNKCPSTIIQMGTGPAHLVKSFTQGFRFWVIDGQFSAYKPRLERIWPAFERVPPDLFIPAPSYIRLDHFVEHTVWSGTTFLQERTSYEEWIKRWGARLPVFDLNNHIKPLTWQAGMKDWYGVGTSFVALASNNNAVDGLRLAWNPEAKGTKVSAVFNIHHNILPVEAGLGLCETDSATGKCEGVALVVNAKATGFEFTVSDVKNSSLRTITSTQVPPSNLKPVWLRCENNTITAGYEETEVISVTSPRPCAPAHPALIVREGHILEAYDLSATQ